ncbi:3533_t:CDS:2 [Cetraspora pellucida]|uniref:3533_t:CDS:1 n=1 Tax=Cetraspora pellucida TaxID=1433469 RepID=A0ACA9K452_9GLOM|nr:3533_t:CDS:2 [Cetraspora pellucida]
MFKKIRFEDIYFQTYYPLSTVAHLPNNEIIVDTENDTFENHVNDFFEYAVKKTRANFLSIPATSVASEQAFSCAGHIIDESRTLLDPNTIIALMCQRN